MVSNQDGLGTDSFPQENFDKPHNAMLDIFNLQGIVFDDILICPHFKDDNCDCRKPNTALLSEHITNNSFDKNNSFVIGDRDTDIELAKNLGIIGLKCNPNNLNWELITEKLLKQPVTNIGEREKRIGEIKRKTKETDISVKVFLDETGVNEISTGIGFFDHMMLDQIATHGGFKMNINCQGDLWIDEHRSVEDIAIVLGEALK